MIYLLVGNRKEQRKALQNIYEEQNIAQNHVQHFYVEDFQENDFLEKIPQNTGLFGERECFVFHNVVKKIINKKLLKQYTTTEHHIIFLEDKLTKKERDIFSSLDLSIKIFAEEEKSEKSFNTFALADLLGKKDKKNLWLSYREAVDFGVSVEEVLGILFWQLKTLALVKIGDTKSLHSFVLRKNEVFAQEWTLEEIQKMSMQLVHMYHHRDVYTTLEIDLEKLILAL